MQRKPENRTHGKAITPYQREVFALIADKWALRLQQRRKARSRIDARTIRELDRDMLEFSRWKQPAPISMIDFNRMTRMRGKSDQPKRSTTRAHAQFIALLSSGQHFTNGQLAKRLKVSKPTIAGWRCHKSINAFLEEANEVSVNPGGSPVRGMVEDAWKRLTPVDSDPETCTWVTDENGEPHSVMVRCEHSADDFLLLHRVAMETGRTVAQIIRDWTHVMCDAVRYGTIREVIDGIEKAKAAKKCDGHTSSTCEGKRKHSAAIYS